ncbi:MAG: TlpA family protein disulfide reductase [Acidisphaera sp.]|nr:TlpA family protein disulfide reductase [Acidisphaera sp.]
MRDIGAMTLADPPKPAPALHFLDARGNRHDLAEYAGKGVVLNLWATWCVPCVAEMPALAKLAAAVADAGIIVLPLSSDHGGAPVVEAFYRAHAIGGLGVWLDPLGAVIDALGAHGIPTTVLLDRQGRERGRIEGAVDWARPDAAEAVRRLTA